MPDYDSCPSAALVRAQVGAALRGQPSALHPRALPGVGGGDGEHLAAALEAAAPGLALMLQLRAQVFDDAAATASGRGVRLVVSIGNGFDDRPDDASPGASPWRWEVDHPDVLAAKLPRTTIRRVAAVDLDVDAWPALRAQGAPLLRARTLFMVHNVLLWSSGSPLQCFLPRFAADAAAGSEILLNVLDGEEAGSGVLDAVASARVPAGSAALVRLHRRFGTLGVSTLAAWDTGDLQRHYLGSGDPLVREFLVWIRKGDGRCGAGRPEAMTVLLGRSRARGTAAASTGPVPPATTRAGLSTRVCIEQPPVRVIAACGRETWAHEVAAEASALLREIARLLSRGQVPATLIDVSVADAHRPRAHATCDASVTVVQIPAGMYSRSILAHELVHVLARSGSVWLSEGLAVWVQRRIAPGPCFPDDAAASGDGGVGLTLAEWLRWPGDLPVALRPLARRPGRGEYRRAASFVEFFIARFGRTCFLQLFTASACPDRVDAMLAVCRRVGCVSLAALEARWQPALCRAGAR